jgi:large subunit ribosomal protein L6e
MKIARPLLKFTTTNDTTTNRPTPIDRFTAKMSSTLEATRPASQKKTFGKSTREVPHHTQKAKKWYPAEDEVQPKKVGSITSTSTESPRASIPVVTFTVLGPGRTRPGRS